MNSVKKYRLFKCILISLIITLLVIAMVLLVICFFFENKCSCDVSFLLDLATALSALSLGSIPLIVLINDKIKALSNLYEREEKETKDNLNTFVKLLDDSKTHFVTCVLAKYNMLKRGFKKKEDLRKYLINCIDSEYYLLENSDEFLLDRFSDENKIIKFLSYLNSLLNKLELICYDFVNFKITKEVFIEEQSEIILKIYNDACNILKEIGSINRFPYIEAMKLMVEEDKQ